MLKRAVLEEQNKNAVLRETLRVKETNLRRVEQEVDSLNFRNKQLEHRVASLQDDLSGVSKKSTKNAKTKSQVATANALQDNNQETVSSSVLSEEFQKKILECAQLTSSIADKTSEIQLQAERIAELEVLVRSITTERSDTEAKLRTQIEHLTAEINNLEAKFVGGNAIGSSDDSLFATECEQQSKLMSLHSNNGTENASLETRLIALEKEMVHWQTKYEALKATLKTQEFNYDKIENKTIEDEKINVEDETNCLTTREKLISDHYAKKVKKLLLDNCVSESKLACFLEEVHFTNLQLYFKD